MGNDGARVAAVCTGGVRGRTGGAAAVNCELGPGWKRAST